MKLARALLCLDDEEVFEGHRCPVCGTEHFVPLARWLGTARTIDRVVAMQEDV